MLAFEYGWTIEDIKEMTLVQINLSLALIEKRKKRELDAMKKARSDYSNKAKR